MAGAVAVRGETWQVICDPKRPGAGLNLSLAEARRACAALGPEWRLVRAEDLGFVQSNLTGLMWRSDCFRLDEEGKDHRFFAYDQKSGWSIVSTTSADLPMKALCIKSVPAKAGPRP